MQSPRKPRVSRVVKIVLVAAGAVVAVYTLDSATPGFVEGIREARATAPAPDAPLAALGASEYWHADESAGGTKPDAAH